MQSYGVSRNAWSAYLDLDAQVTDAFNVTAAARFEDYSDFGTTATWKLGARYDFSDAFALRGTVSSGFRAPALQQQFFTATAINFLNYGGQDVMMVTGRFGLKSYSLADPANPKLLDELTSVDLELEGDPPTDFTARNWIGSEMRSPGPCATSPTNCRVSPASST